MQRYLVLLWLLFLIPRADSSAQVKNAYLYNPSTPYGVLDIRTEISATNYFYLQEDITFSFREKSPGVKSNTFLDMTPWDSSPYGEGNLRHSHDGKDDFVMNYRMLMPPGYDENLTQGYPMIVLFHGGRERGNCFYEDCFHAGQDYDPNVNSPPAPTAADHQLLNNDYHMIIGAKEHLAARDAAAGFRPDDPSLPAKAFPGFVLMPQMMNIWDSLNVQDVIRIVQLHCRKYNIDEDRIYIEGLSIGGYAMYESLKRASWLFAAAVPMSAVRDANIFAQNQQSKVAHIPLWAFQGGIDKNPTPAYTESILQKLRSAGGLPKYTLYPANGHVVWGKTFAEPDFYRWLLGQSKRNLHLANNISEINAANNVFPRLELAEGFLAYQWQKDGVTIPGATSNKLTPTEAGNYRARFSRISATPSETQWNEWSAAVTITNANPPPPPPPDDGGGDPPPPDDGGGDPPPPDDGGGDPPPPDDGGGDPPPPDDGGGDPPPPPDDGGGDPPPPDDGGGDPPPPDDGGGDPPPPGENTGGGDPELPPDSVITSIDTPFGDVDVFPNPVTENRFSVGFQQNPGAVDVVIYDALGRPVYNSLQVVDDNYSLEVSPSLQKGLYLLIIKTKSTTVQRRLLIGR